jgi:hypothetical protein
LLSLSKTEPANVYEGQSLDYSYTISDDPAAGPAYNVTLYETLPAQLIYNGPGSLQYEGYSGNDQWRHTSVTGLIALGPFNLQPGDAINLDLFTTVRYNTAPGTVSNTAYATADRLAAAPTAFAAVPILVGIAPTRTITPTFSVSPTFSSSPTPNMTQTDAVLSQTPTKTVTLTLTYSSTPTPNGTFTSSPTPVPGPTLSLSMVLDTDPASIYVGQDVSFTVSVLNAVGAANARDLVLKAMRDLGSNNAKVSEVQNQTASTWPGSLSGAPQGTWVWSDPSNQPASDWYDYYPNTSAGSGHTIPLWYHVLPAAAGSTLTSQIVVQVNGQPYGLSTTVNVVVPLYTPTANITNTPTITPTPAAGMGQIVAYPQPAVNNLCFEYQAPSGNDGKFDLFIYNVAFQLVGEVKDQAVSGIVQKSCVDISRMAPGVYFYRASLGAYSFPPGRFGVAR